MYVFRNCQYIFVVNENCNTDPNYNDHTTLTSITVRSTSVHRYKDCFGIKVTDNLIEKAKKCLLCQVSLLLPTEFQWFMMDSFIHHNHLLLNDSITDLLCPVVNHLTLFYTLYLVLRTPGLFCAVVYCSRFFYHPFYC